MNIILPINSTHVEKIFLGEKKYEFRRVAPKRNFEKILIYETAPVSKIVGEFAAKEKISLSISDLWKKTRLESGISEDFFLKYFRGKKIGHAFSINDVIRYKKPTSLKAMGINHPPQSFLYIEER